MRRFPLVGQSLRASEDPVYGPPGRLDEAEATHPSSSAVGHSSGPISDIKNRATRPRTREVARRTAWILIAILSLGVALGGAASASARPKSSNHRACPIAKARRARYARSSRCRARNRHSIRHSTRHSVDHASGLVIGLNASVAGWANMAPRLNQVVSESGTNWLREDFKWTQIEPEPGTFDFSRYDQYMLLTAQHGVHVLPLLFDTPSWAGPSEDSIPADPSGYAAYVAAVVGRYGPHGSFWTQHPALSSYAIQTFELWNEPYYDNGNNGNYDPGRYARIVKAAAIAARQVDPDARFLLAAENQAQHLGNAWVWWINALYQAVPDLNNYFDGVAVHPYGTNLTNLSFPTVGRAYDGYEQIRRVQAIHQEFAAHSAASKPLWITEIGWPTCTSGSDRCTTPAGQAAKLTTVFNDARTTWKSFVHAVFVYSFDDSHPDSSDPENDYGLAYNDGTPKPAMAVFKADAGN